MPYFEMTLDELERYRPTLTAPEDLDARWRATLEEARRHPIAVERQPYDAGLRVIDVEDVTFAGFGGDRIRAWLLRPAGAAGDLPVIVRFVGYGGGRGLPHEHLVYPAAGYAHLVVDTRGQGSQWGTGGDTPDTSGGGDAAAAASNGFMTRGILDFDTYYYRRVFTDAARAVDAARAMDGIDGDRVVVMGSSQGGGIALAAASLVPDVSAALLDVPFLCHFERAIVVAEGEPYSEIVRYLAVHRGRDEAVMRTLSYVDGVHLGARAVAPALFSVALRDGITPPSTVYTAYRAWGGDKELVVYSQNGHEGGESYQVARQLDYLDKLWS